jgi:transcription-repair coupling factor (superfamily II helicase)
MHTTNKTNYIFIASITPYFLEKEVFWFQEHKEEILTSLKTQAFFQDNIVFLESNKDYTLMQILRKLDEMGYEKVFKVESPGEFSHQGGVLDIFPINMNQAVRLDFLGNKIETIQLLDTRVENEEKAKDILKKKLTSQKLFSDIKNIKPGDFLVHLDHGVAKFCGIETVAMENEKTNTKTEEQYYILEYAQNDKLFVPVGLERKLSKYVGFTDPTVSRLASLIWQHTKRKIREDVEKLAKELLALYSQKEVVVRTPYENDNELEKELLAGFEYQETPDQLKAMEDIKNDLAQEKPMDRIVCGDVGFGKTEIAIRAAFLAGVNNRQCAVICPTTILASQHYENFKKRFGKLPFKIALLSRLQTVKEQQKIIHDIKEGKIDIIIGTHRVLSSDLEFKNLQLLIIDDEQRFGVKQKEKLRGKNPSLDLLSLSATPIPRTIYLALSSFKNISLMQTPPKGRTAIHTNILPYNKAAIKEAINQELEHGGQVYFLHNRVETIEKTKVNLQKLIPEARIGIIHGRMDEKEVMKTMEEFSLGKKNILIATTIIENGIDLPHVNTIIVEDASRLGLSQAYQIRGRVGRGHQKSSAYLFYPKHISDVARERLKALGEANELGSGYRIAMKDLELRGAGNVLGREQSGSINKIGLNLYCQMLAEAVEKLR